MTGLIVCAGFVALLAAFGVGIVCGTRDTEWHRSRARLRAKIKGADAERRQADRDKQTTCKHENTAFGLYTGREFCSDCGMRS